MSNRHKISTVLGIIVVLICMYSYLLVEKNNVVLLVFIISLSNVLNNLFNKKKIILPDVKREHIKP